MKALPASDPRSWRFQANIHGTLDPASNPLFNQCEHGTLLFLAWHRGYLYYFERILRWAAGDPELTLPYWDWTTAPALPDPYRTPASPSNPLYDATRMINDGSALPPDVVVDDLNTALNFVPFPPNGSIGFSPSLEGSPHGAVHVLVGGNMGSVPTAANDPIFWLHHGNMDRIWDRWLNLGGGRLNPSDAAFLDTPYSFADETGGTVTVKVRDIISSLQLGYRYDDVPNPPNAAVRPAWRVAAGLENGTGGERSGAVSGTLARPERGAGDRGFAGGSGGGVAKRAGTDCGAIPPAFSCGRRLPRGGPGIGVRRDASGGCPGTAGRCRRLRPPISRIGRAVAAAIGSRGVDNE
jgi:Common central domain of tyrosinase/Polyphenol oxidase middle domain